MSDHQPAFLRLFTRRWPSLTLLLAGIFVHLRELLGARPYFRDTHQVYVPAKHFLWERFHAGELPQWWPWDGGGSPLIPQPVFSVFHPTTLFYLLPSFWAAFTLQNLCVTWGALLGAFALGRTLRLSCPAALVAGGLYGLSGYFSCLSEHQFMALSAATMPWYLAGIVLAGRHGRRWLVAPAAAMGLLLLAGDPQVAILSSVAGVGLALANTKYVRRSLLVAILSPVIGALLAAVQLFPSIAVLPDTERGYSMTNERWALGLRHIFGMVWPVDHGAADWVRSTLFGLPGIALVLISLITSRTPGRRRLVLMLFSLSGLSLWLATGNAGGLNRIARLVIPIWSQLRYPMKSVILAYLALALLAGIGLAELGERARRLGAGLTWAALLVVAEAAAFAQPLYLTVEPGFYDPPPIARALQRDGIGLEGGSFERPFSPPAPENEWAQRTRAGSGGYGTSFGALFGLPSITPSMPGSSWRILKLFGPDYREVTDGRLLGAFGVKDVVLREPVEERLAPQVLARDADAGNDVVRLQHSLPRAYVTFSATGAENPNEAISSVSSPDFKPGREVVLENAPVFSSAEKSPAVPASVMRRTNTGEVRIRFSAPRDGYLVLNEAAFRGWSATVDGMPRLVYTANAFVRAVAVPAGGHEAVFSFETPGLRAGAIVSAAAWLLLLATLVALMRQRVQVVGDGRRRS